MPLTFQENLLCTFLYLLYLYRYTFLRMYIFPPTEIFRTSSLAASVPLHASPFLCMPLHSFACLSIHAIRGNAHFRKWMQRQVCTRTCVSERCSGGFACFFACTPRLPRHRTSIGEMDAKAPQVITSECSLLETDGQGVLKTRPCLSRQWLNVSQDHALMS